MIKRAEIWIACLGTPNGSEQRGTRPVLVIQNDTGNLHSPTVIVASLTDASKRYMPTHIPVTAAETGLLKDSVIMMEQIRTVDKSALREKICTLPDHLMKKVNNAIKVSLGLIPAGEKKGEKVG